MKTLFAILAMCLVASQAAPQVNYETQVNGIIHEAEKIAVETAQALEHQFKEIVIDPLHEVEKAVQAIENRKDEHEDCVVAQDPAVTQTVDIMHKEMEVCGVVAAKTSAQIMVDISDATQQLVFDGYDVLRTYQKCKKYKNSVLKNSCYARLSIKATLYLKNARRSMKTIKKSTNERIPAVFTDADACTHSAAEKAITQLDSVNAEIDTCVARS